MSTGAAKPDKALNFESAMTELESIVRDMESGKTGLEDSMKAYERGMELKNICQHRLDEAQLRIAEIAKNDQGGLVAKPVTPQE
jgi:exodeoxyribonuclease VII small subunit